MKMFDWFLISVLVWTWGWNLAILVKATSLLSIEIG